MKAQQVLENYLKYRLNFLLIKYILTELNKITRLIFPAVDDKILTYLNDDGTCIQPNYYIPIIPMVLINGAKGIGTGFSTDIMCYNPIQIIIHSV